MFDAPEPQDSSPEPGPPPGPPSSPWRSGDLIMFGVFFGLTVLFLPLILVYGLRIFQPTLQLTELSAVDQIVMQVVMDVVLVGFIVFLVKVVHGRSFRETIHWYPQHPYSPGFLIAFGASLAVTVMIVSSYFPPSSTTPIEKLLTSTRALYVFILFGVTLAPLFEEIIFRGFLFTVFFDLFGRSAALPITAALFALLHSPQLWGSWAGIILIFVVGYILAMLRDRSGSLIPSLIVHASYNGMLFAAYLVSTLAQKAAGK